MHFLLGYVFSFDFKTDSQFVGAPEGLMVKLTRWSSFPTKCKANFPEKVENMHIQLCPGRWSIFCLICHQELDDLKR